MNNNQDNNQKNYQNNYLFLVYVNLPIHLDLVEFAKTLVLNLEKKITKNLNKEKENLIEIKLQKKRYKDKEKFSCCFICSIFIFDKKIVCYNRLFNALKYYFIDENNRTINIYHHYVSCDINDYNNKLEVLHNNNSFYKSENWYFENKYNQEENNQKNNQNEFNVEFNSYKNQLTNINNNINKNNNNINEINSKELKNINDKDFYDKKYKYIKNKNLYIKKYNKILNNTNNINNTNSKIFTKIIDKNKILPLIKNTIISYENIKYTETDFISSVNYKQAYFQLKSIIIDYLDKPKKYSLWFYGDVNIKKTSILKALFAQLSYDYKNNIFMYVKNCFSRFSFRKNELDSLPNNFKYTIFFDNMNFYINEKKLLDSVYYPRSSFLEILEGSENESLINISANEYINIPFNFRKIFVSDKKIQSILAKGMSSFVNDIKLKKEEICRIKQYNILTINDVMYIKEDILY